MTTFGTHNLLDGKAPATPFADVIFFTEATAKVRRELDETHDVYVCARQRDLVIAVAKSLGWDGAEAHYDKALFGVRRVSPHRGTFWLTIPNHRIALLVEHRINAAFPPYRRGEPLFRRLAWWSHTRVTLRIIRRLIGKGYTVYAGGDANTPHGVSAYQGVLHEGGVHYDRVGASVPITQVEYLSRLGSDHPRLRSKKRDR